MSGITTAVFGDSYVKRLHYLQDCAPLEVEGGCSIIGIGGLKVLNLPQRKVEQLIALRPKVVILNVGGNDISPATPANTIYQGICSFVEKLKEEGIEKVYVGEILKRGNFSKVPGLTEEHFEKERKKINRKLYKKFGGKKRNGFFVAFSENIKYPDHYEKDLVHPSYTVGLRRFWFQTKRILESSVAGPMTDW